jgi:hypothetical protein
MVRKLIAPFVLAGVLLFGNYLILLDLSSTTIARADTNITLCVNPGGTGGCYAKIQDAIDAAVGGEVIQVDSGTYVEHITLKDNVSIYGQGWDYTIIDGKFSTSAATVDIPPGISASTIISGVRVTGGGPGNITEEVTGGGIAIWYSSPRIINTWVVSNTAKFGGGVYVNHGSPTFENVPAWDNRAYRGGGFYLLSTDVTISGDPFVGTNGTVWINSATDDGGGFYIIDSAISMTGLRIWWNGARQGGGVYIVNDSKPATLWANQFLWNQADAPSGGAGIHVYQSNNLEFVLNHFEANNSADSSQGGGGAVFIQSDGLVQWNWFIKNTALKGGGGVTVLGPSTGPMIQGNWFEDNQGSAGGGVYIGSQGAPPINANTIVSNTAGIGGGIYMWNSGESFITNNIIARNTKPSGPGGIGSGVAIIESPGQLINNTIADNHENGVYFSEAEGMAIVNNIISGNTYFGIIEDLESNTLDTTIDYNDLYGNSNPYSGGVTGGLNDMYVNPLFISSGDFFEYYHIQDVSPVGTTGAITWAPGYDIDGDLRLLGGSVSMGADEIYLSAIFLPLVEK